MIDSYLQELFNVEKQGDAREESYYSTLETLLNDCASSEGHDNIHVTVLPKQTEAGNPDFRVWDGRQHIVGYIEAKQPGSDLDKIARSEQLTRYRETFPNVILTDFYNFRLYREGEEIERVQVGRHFVAKQLDTVAPAEKMEAFRLLMQRFFSFVQPKAYTAEELAVTLARRTRFLDHVIKRELLEGTTKEARRLHGFYEAFSQYLISGLTRDQFADLYAQTITYGLFAARSRADGDFRRETAHEHIPETIGILRDVFAFISYGHAPKQVEVVVDDLANVLQVADIGGILKRYFRDGRGDDPILHFYETFLAEYDPALRERRGVYYTPEAVVGYIVRSLDHLLRDVFGKSDGLAATGVTVLDPAAGTLTFIVEAFRQAIETYTERYGEGGRTSYIKDHLLKNFYAFELMMAPYAIGHLKTGYILEELGHELGEDERFKLFLTNTLEMEDIEQTELPGMDALSEESRAAGRVKKKQPVLVVMGNPPYSGHSANNSAWIDKLLKEGYGFENGASDDGYYRVDGAPLGERNTKWLQDDYVKFLRFAQWKIDQHGHGVVGFITNHSFLDNPTFRGMRESLMQTFDRIYALDLHGNSLKKEKAPGGGPDQNVFDIRQGVAITFLVKGESLTSRHPEQRKASHGIDHGSHTESDSVTKSELTTDVYRADLFGKRDAKYDWLKQNNLNSTDWTEIAPQSPFYFFTERDYDLLKTYNRFVALPDLFPAKAVGVVTARDRFVIDFDRDTLERRIRQFRDPNLPDDLVREAFSLRDNRDWKMSAKRKLIQQDDNWQESITKTLYRPFDVRPIFYHYHAIDFGREDVMRHMLAGDNMGLVYTRPKSPSYEFSLLVTDTIIDQCAVGNKTAGAGISYLAPLYRYLNAENGNGSARKDGGTIMMVFEEKATYGERIPNIDGEFYNALNVAYGEKPSPEAILHYVYAVLYAPAYGSTYAAFLKTDFPRIPFPNDAALFQELAVLGSNLTELHLMKADVLNTPTCRFHGEGSNRVAKSKRVGRNYDGEAERVTINEEGQHFGPIPQDVWEYQVGGYQVLDKWLYDRRERILTTEEIKHYCRVVTALNETIRTQEAIDAVYPGIEEDLLTLEVGSH